MARQWRQQCARRACIPHNNTPPQLAVAAKIARLAGAECALVTGRGMAATSATLMSLLSQGDPVIAIAGYSTMRG